MDNPIVLGNFFEPIFIPRQVTRKLTLATLEALHVIYRPLSNLFTLNLQHYLNTFLENVGIAL